MQIPAFDPKELEISGYAESRVPGLEAKKIPLYSFPVTYKEAMKAYYDRRPIWIPTGIETKYFVPSVCPDNVARGLIIEAEPFNPIANGGGKDMFGIEWEFVPSIMGSMVRPGKPFLSDANEWYDKLVWPDVDSWDWEASVKMNAEALPKDKFIQTWIMTGFYERLISFMDFENAVLAMIDDDQKQAIHDLFDRLADLYCDMVDHYVKYFPEIDCFYIHDDWGGQKETFFSPAVVEEMIVPHMRKLTDHIHSIGRYAELHSCGQILKQVPNMIKAGWDAWTGQIMNDSQEIYRLYGDQILLGVVPDMYDVANASEEEQRAAARAYAEKFCDPKRPCCFSMYGAPVLTDAYREELYICSRKAFSGAV